MSGDLYSYRETPPAAWDLRLQIRTATRILMRDYRRPMLNRLLAGSFLVVFLLLGQAQVLRSEDEQSTFAVEEIAGEPRVTHPVAVPEKVLEVLQRDQAVKSCLKDNPLAPDQSLSSWFVASVIHLDGPTEADLIVLPSFHGQESMCFQTPSGIGLFWLFMQNGQRYELVLKTWGSGLQILKSEVNGHRNIQTGTLGQAGRVLTNTVFGFDGIHYVERQEAASQSP